MNDLLDVLRNPYVVALIKFAVVIGAFLGVLAYLQLVERKVLAHIQLRLGPHRTGPHGLLQPIADTLKLFLKEDLLPPYVNRFYYLAAPFLAVAFGMISISLIPFGPEVEVLGVKTRMVLADLNIGVLVALAVSSMSVYAIALAGWSSNNKYALMGGLRSSAQMISYELPLALTIAAPLLMMNTLNFSQIVERQGDHLFRWNAFALVPFPQWPQIFSFILFLIAAFAETNRVPFDLPEAENELVAGFHTEYSSMKFAAFFMAEYANIVTITAIATTLFLGGWQPIFPAKYGSDFVPVLLMALTAGYLLTKASAAKYKWDRYSYPVFAAILVVIGLIFLIPVLKPFLIPIFWFCLKTGGLVFLFIWIRGTLPRFRYDQLMKFAWTFMFPAALINLLITALMVALFPNAGGVAR